MLTNTIAVCATAPELNATAKALADILQIPWVNHPESADYIYLLMVTPDYIGIQKNESGQQAVYVDFMSKAWRYRQQQFSLKNEVIARALGLKHKTTPTIIDATGGLARDSFILASLGFKVTMLERSPIIYTLIADGLKRGKQHPEIQPALQRMNLIQADAITWLTALNTSEKPDIIYLDPMFPERKKSALPKKEMLIFHDIVGDDQDADALLSTALTCATQRVVVKRPRLADSLKASCSPSFSRIGSSCRFDIYLK